MRVVVSFFTVMAISASTVFGADVQQYAVDPIPYSYPRFQVEKIDPYTFGKCLGVIAKTSTESHFTPIDAVDGTPHTYEEFLKYLAAQQDRKDFTTDHNADLQAWVLKQNDSSVDPAGLFQYALSLNEQNIWGALVNIHDLLRTHARWWILTPQAGKGNGGGGGGGGNGGGGGSGGGDSGGSILSYSFLQEQMKISTLAGEVVENGITIDPVNLSTNFYNKLIDIRGDLKERGTAFHGDHKGTWYRIWGMMLYRLAIQGSTLKNFQNISSTKKLTSDEKDLLHRKDIKTKILAFGVELEKIRHGTEEDTRKTEINLMASNAAAAFWTQLYAPGEYAGWQPTLEQCHSGIYLKNVQ